MAISTGDRVRIHYRGRLKDGAEFDSTYGGEPLTFVAGSRELIAAVSHAVLGMEVGEHKTVDVPPELGYGPRREEMVVRVHTSQLPEGAEVGAVLGLNTPKGQVQVVVRSIEGEEALLDGNHLLAGRHLVFEIEVVGVEQI
jgi:peptidylprolyl isomerase